MMGMAAAACFAQQWEVGGTGGGAFVPGTSISSSYAPATTGFQSGAAFGGYFGQNLYPHLSGEVHYEFQQSNLRLSSGGTEATFSGQAHAVHYDLVYHTNKKGSRVQYFVSAGGGLRIFRGTGAEEAYQPLSQYAYFTKTQVLKPMGTFAAGMKYKLTPRLILRTEFRDYITPFPDKLIAPAPGAHFGGILHDFVPMVGIAYEY
jgi:hypothetical protein